jgi:hypothetical protein
VNAPRASNEQAAKVKCLRIIFSDFVRLSLPKKMDAPDSVVPTQITVGRS